MVDIILLMRHNRVTQLVYLQQLITLGKKRDIYSGLCDVSVPFLPVLEGVLTFGVPFCLKNRGVNPVDNSKTGNNTQKAPILRLKEGFL